MKNNPIKPHRSVRLKAYDYTQPGAYFVTIVTRNRTCLFGDVVEGEVRLSNFGEIARRNWQAMGEHFPYTESDVL